MQAVPECSGREKKYAPKQNKKIKPICRIPFNSLCAAILQVNGVQLYGKSRREAVTFLKEVPPPFTLVCCRRLFEDGSEFLVDEPPVAAAPPEQQVTPLSSHPPVQKDRGTFWGSISGFVWFGLEKCHCPGKAREVNHQAALLTVHPIHHPCT